MYFLIYIIKHGYTINISTDTLSHVQQDCAYMVWSVRAQMLCTENQGAMRQWPNHWRIQGWGTMDGPGERAGHSQKNRKA